MEVQRVALPARRDARGTLVVAELTQGVLPFEVQRLFWQVDVPPGAVRGQHAHKRWWEALIPVSGGLRVVLDDGTERVEVWHDDPASALILPPRVWVELRDFLPGTALLVLASEPWAEAGYWRDYAAFVEDVRAGR